MRHIHLTETVSTNTYIKELLQQGVTLPGLTVVEADWQTAGRGQKGNQWESKKGENLLFSILCHPSTLPASHQFVLSQAMALSVWAALDEIIEGVNIKWPNDIYWEEKKMGGILIECNLVGSGIADCILGVGLNVNQTQFVSDAPNPVSLAQIIGFSLDRDRILSSILSHFETFFQMAEQSREKEIADLYMAHLYRREGFHMYREVGGEPFSAEIAGIAPSGLMTLRTKEGKMKEYEFKEIIFIHQHN